MRYKNTIRLAFFGLLSGILSFLLTIIIPIFGELSAYITSGIIFGIAFGIYFFLFYFKNSLFFKAPIWIAISTGAYYSAVSTTLSLGSMMYNLSLQDSFIPFIIGGFVGSFLMLLGFHLLLIRLSLLQFISLCIAGSILGLSWYIIPQRLLFNSGSYGVTPESFLGLYLFWQTGMAAGLGWVLDKRENNSQNNAQQN